jgi:tetratricopeptide (TPR) repeat protein
MTWLISFLIIVPAFGADPDTIQRNVTTLVQRADQALASNHNADAEQGYQMALKECDSMPPDRYHCKTGVLWSLGRFYSQIGDVDQAEAVYRQRVDILTAHQRPGMLPDLDLGIALFDLQSTIEGVSIKNTDREAEGLADFEKARAFYENCKSGFPDMKAVCDRRLADVEGLHGSVLFLKKRFDEATPFLRSVIDRPDEGVRRVVLTAALRAFSTILISKGQIADAQPLMERVRRLESAAP